MKKTELIYFLIAFFIFVTLAQGDNYHGSAMAPGSLNGWVVRIDTPMVFHTFDGGHNWQNQSFLDPLSYFDVFALNSQKVWIGGNLGFIHFSPDGGQTWYLQRMGLSKWTSRIFCINDTVGWAACGSAIIGKTVHATDTIYQMDLWEQINLTNPPFSADSCDIYGIHFVNENLGWFCAGRYPESDSEYIKGQGYIAKTTDGGGNALTWQLLKRDTIYDFFDIKFIDSLTGFVVGGDDRTNNAVVLKTQNGGTNWSFVTIPNQAKILRSIEIVGNRHIWAVGRNGTIIYSNNGGSSWITQTSGVDTTLFDVDFADTLNGIIAGNGYVLYTHNGGSTWSITYPYAIEEQSTKISLLKSQVSIQAIPNPFYTQTVLKIPNLNSSDNLIHIYNASGRLIKSLKASHSSAIWNGKDRNGNKVSSGIYFARVKSDKNFANIPIILLK